MKTFSATNDNQIRELFRPVRDAVLKRPRPGSRRGQDDAKPSKARPSRARGRPRRFQGAHGLCEGREAVLTNIAGLTLRDRRASRRASLAYLQFHFEPLGARTGRRVRERLHERRGRERVRGTSGTAYPGSRARAPMIRSRYDLCSPSQTARTPCTLAHVPLSRLETGCHALAAVSSTRLR